MENTVKLVKMTDVELMNIEGGKRRSGYFRNGYGTAHNVKAASTAVSVAYNVYRVARWFI